MRNIPTHELKFCLALALAAPGWTAGAQEYKNLHDVEATIQSVATAAYPDATSFTLKDSSGEEILTGGDALSTPIWCLEIAKSGATSRKILVTGTQHAREWVAYRAVLDAAKFILDNRPYTTWPPESNPD